MHLLLHEQKPEKTKDGKSTMSRSILGSPQEFDAFAKTGRRHPRRRPSDEYGGGRSSANQRADSLGSRDMEDDMSAGSHESEEDEAEEKMEKMDAHEYMHLMRTLTQHSTNVRVRAALSLFLSLSYYVRCEPLPFPPSHTD